MKYVKVYFTCLIAALVVSCSVAATNEDKDNGKKDSVADQVVDNKNDSTTTTATTSHPSSTTNSTSSGTTVTPVTTPIPVTPSTPVPTPLPSDVWTVSFNGTICIQMQSKVDLKVKYVADSKTKTENTTEFKVPSNVKVSGSCGSNSSTQNLKLSWGESTNNTNSVTFTFEKSKDGSEYDIKDINATLYVNVTGKDNKTDSVSVEFNHTGKLFTTDLKNSYKCTDPPATDLAGATLNATGQLLLQALQYEAFGVKNKTGFSDAKDCSAQSGTPDIVPILVAGALILLVITVLVAYVITRRRSQSSGYLSM